MGQPNYSPLPDNVQVEKLPGGRINISLKLIDLLITARSDYEWPYGTGKTSSQMKVRELEGDVETLLKVLSPESAQSIIQKISFWGGNNKVAKKKIEAATSEQRKDTETAIKKLGASHEVKEGLTFLSAVPGIGFVIATKVYRFCYPEKGAALDRHSSYFFNSLDLVELNGSINKSTRFKREWSNGKHITSRLAIYNLSYFSRNLDEYVFAYLPLLRNIADGLNGMGRMFTCAATKDGKEWGPADVEMAAYFWWARNGAR